MHISLFPEELLVEIFSYMDLDDLLSCCLVNKAWREAGNTNSLWLKLCSRRSPVQKNKFERIGTSSLVEPVYSPLHQSCSSLSEVCGWRQRFMQEAHISRNWRYGRFVSYPLPGSGPRYCSYQMSAWDLYDIRCEESLLDDNDALVLLNNDRTSFSAYDISSKPELIQNNQLAHSNMEASFFKYCFGKLVVVQGTLLQVYSKNSNNNTLEFTLRLHINKKEKDGKYSLQHPNTSEWYDSTVDLFPSDTEVNCDHNGEHFVGLARHIHPPVFHIWDLNSGHKVAEQTVPSVDGINDVSILFSVYLSNLNMLVKDGKNCISTIRCFDLKSLTFTSLNLEFSYVKPCVVFGAKLVFHIDNSSERLCIWRKKNGSLLHELSCDFIINEDSITYQSSSSFLMFAGLSSSGYITVRVFNTSSLQDVCVMSTNCRCLGSFPRFVRGDLVLFSDRKQIELWDIKIGQRVRSFDYEDCYWLSSCGVKALLRKRNKLILFRFW